MGVTVTSRADVEGWASMCLVDISTWDRVPNGTCEGVIDAGGDRILMGLNEGDLR